MMSFVAYCKQNITMASLRKLAPAGQIFAAQFGFDRFDVMLHAMMLKVLNGFCSRKFLADSERIPPL